MGVVEPVFPGCMGALKGDGKAMSHVAGVERPIE